MSRRPQNRTWVFVATHTTGLDENQHEVLDLAVLDSNGDTLLHTAFVPENLAAADQDVLDSVGFSPGDWAPSPVFGKKARQILGHLTGAVIVGHNTQLDMRFINRLLRAAFVADEEIEEEEIDGMMARIDARFIDTVTLAWEQLGRTHLWGLSLHEVCHFLRIPFKPNHSALEDARAARAVYEKLLRASWIQRRWWKWLAPKSPPVDGAG